MLEVASFIVVMLVLYLLLFSRFGLFQHMIRAREERKRRMFESRPDRDNNSGHVK